MKKLFVLLLISTFLMPSIGVRVENKNLAKEDYMEMRLNLMPSHFPIPGCIETPFYIAKAKLPFNIKIKKIEIEAKEKKEIEFKPNILPKISINGRIIGVAKSSMPPYLYKIGKGIYNGNHTTWLIIDAFPFMEYGRYYIYTKLKIKIWYEKIADLPDEYDMLIITPSAFFDEAKELAEFKNRHGIKCIVEKVEDIYSNYNGNDNAERIKYAIKDAIEKYGIKYVLLFGGVDSIPPRYSNLSMVSNSFISELYYADIYAANGSFSSWDSNHNGYYGEGDYRSLIDKVDLYPDVYVGRLAFKNESEAKNFVNKIMAYESMEKPWFKNLLLIAGDTHPWYKDIMVSGVRGISFEGEQTCDEIASYMKGFNAIKLYATNFNNPLTDENILKEINKGVGFVVFSGHGFIDKWATHPPYRAFKWVPENGFSLDDVKKLDKKDASIYIFDACLCGKIDEDCIAWDIVKQAGVASFGLTTYGLLLPGKKSNESLNGYMTTHLFKNYENATTIGEMFYNAITDYLNAIPNMPASLPINVLTPEEWILLGDPSMVIKCSS